MPQILDMLADEIIIHIQSMPKPDPDPSNHEYLLDISDEYISTFRLIAKDLNDEISSSDVTASSLLFYLSAILLQFILHRMIAEPLTIFEGKDIRFSKALAALLDTLVLYKEQMAGRGNAIVEERLRGYDFTRVSDAASSESTERFSDQWWTGFFLAYDDSGLRGIEKGLLAAPSTPLEVTLQPPASAPDEIHPPVPDIAHLSSSAISPRISPESIIIASSITLNPDVDFVPDVSLDALLPRQADKHPAGPDAQLSSLPSPANNDSTGQVNADIQPLPISSTLSYSANGSPVESLAQGILSHALPSGLLARDVPSRNPPAPGDSVIDVPLPR